MSRNCGYYKVADDGAFKYISDAESKDLVGKYIMGIQSWFDEHPEKLKELNVVKIINAPPVEYDPVTQFVTVVQQKLDDTTIQKVQIVKNKSEEMTAMEFLIQNCEKKWFKF